MSEHMRGPARRERTIRPGFVGAIIAVAAAAVVGALVFANTRTPASNQATQAIEATDATQTDAAQTDAAKTDATKDDSNASTASNQSNKGTDAAKDEEKQAQNSKDGSVTNSSNNSAADSSEETKDASATEGTGESSATSNGSARIGNNYVDANGERKDTADSQTSQDETSVSSSGTGTDTGAYNTTSGGSSESGSGASVDTTASSRSKEPLYGVDSGWIEAGSCATEVRDDGAGTASDIRWDDDYPQVGLDKSSYPWAHFGEYVEIEYEGNTVRAQIVDCGYYGAGTSGIILNPGVFNQFGAEDADDWGRRDVSYRFV